MSTKKRNVTIIGPCTTYPHIDVQTLIRGAIMDRVDKSDDDWPRVVAEEAARECAPIQGYYVAETNNTVIVVPGDILSHKDVSALVDNVDLDVKLKKPADDAPGVVVQTFAMWEELNK